MPATVDRTAVVEEIISSLCGQVEAAEDRAERWSQQIFAERKRANEAERRAAAMLEALRPFAEVARGIGAGWDGERRMASLSTEPLRVRHLRLALALVDAATNSPNGASPA